MVKKERKPINILKPKEIPRALFYFAWRKARQFQLRANVAHDPAEMLLFEQSLDDQLDALAEEFQTCTYRTRPAKVLPFPKEKPLRLLTPDERHKQNEGSSKNSPRCRPMTLVTFRDQVAWATALLVLGSAFDTNFASEEEMDESKWMVDWSCAGRLYRRFISVEAPIKEQERKRGPISYTCVDLYDSVTYAWNRYRQLVSHRARELTSRKRGLGEAYYGKTDLRQFFPSLSMSFIKVRLMERLSMVDRSALNAWRPLLDSLFSFQLDYGGLSDADLESMGTLSEQGRLPIGLLSSPFLANVALTSADQVIEAQFRDRLDNKDFAIARYMDDITVVAADQDLVRDVLRCYREHLPRGVEMNEDKTEPKGVLSDDNSVKIEWKTLTKHNLTPFLTTTLRHLSDIGAQDFRALNAYERKRMGEELMRLVRTEFTPEEIRTDTKLSFASWRLKKLALQSHALHLKKEYRSLRNEAEACLRMAPTKLGIIQSTLSLLLEAGEKRKLKVFLLRWFFRKNAYWGTDEPAGQFIRGYVLYLMALEVQRHSREGDPTRERLRPCFRVIHDTVQSFYGNKGEGGWYERAALYWLLAHMNMRLTAAEPCPADDDRHVAWSKQLYLLCTAKGRASSLDKLPEGATANLLLEHPAEWKVVATAACLTILVRDERRKLVDSRLKALWGRISNLKTLVERVPRAILRLVSLYAEQTPPKVVQSLLQLGPFSQSHLSGIHLAMESEAGAIWRTTIQIWFETHLYQDGSKHLLDEMKRELGDNLPLGSRQLLAVMEKRLEGGEFIPLNRWIRLQWQASKPEVEGKETTHPRLHSELEITNLMIRVVQFVARNTNRYAIPGSLHLDSIAIRSNARPGRVKDVDLRVVSQELVDDRYTSAYALVRSLAVEDREPTDIHISYSLAIMLLRLLQRQLDGGTSLIGLRKLRPWHHMGSIFAMTQYPSSALVSLIAGALQFDQYLFRPRTNRRVLVPLPINTLEQWRRVLGSHWQSLKQTRYLGREAWEAYQVDLDDFFPGSDGNRAEPTPDGFDHLPPRLKIVVAQLRNPEHRFDPKRRMRVKREWYGRTQDLVVTAMQTAEQEREREAGELREQRLERQRAAKGTERGASEVPEIKLEEPSPLIVLLPELYLPRGMEYSLLVPWARHLGAIVIAGREYGPVPSPVVDTGEMVNDAVVVVPSGRGRRSRVTVIPVPKLTAPPQEEEFLLANSRKRAKYPYRFRAGRAFYLFHSSVVGNFAVLICFDFLNLPIQALLQRNIHTLYVIAHNADLSTYDAMAEAAIRLLHCNVVICNVADYGGSLVVTPYKDAHDRERLRFRGNGVEGAVAVSIPLRALAQHQADGKPDTGEEVYDTSNPLKPTKRMFKPLPPDFGTLRARFRGVPVIIDRRLR